MAIPVPIEKAIRRDNVVGASYEVNANIINIRSAVKPLAENTRRRIGLMPTRTGENKHTANAS